MRPEAHGGAGGFIVENPSENPEENGKNHGKAIGKPQENGSMALQQEPMKIGGTYHFSKVYRRP